MDSMYITSPTELVDVLNENDESIGLWMPTAVIALTKNYAIFRVRKLPDGLVAFLKLNRHTTYNPEQERDKSVWLKQKLWNAVTHLSPRNIAKKSLRGWSKREDDPIEREQDIYFKLREKAAKAVPLPIDTGFWNGHSFVVLERYGESVLSKMQRQTLTIGDICNIARGAIIGLQNLHAIEYVHQNLSAEALNYGILSEERDSPQVFLTNFEQARKVPRFSQAFLQSQREEYSAGSCTFASLARHANLRLTKRDDLESFAYLLLFLVNGTLPWAELARETNWKVTAQLKVDFQTYMNSFEDSHTLPSEFTLILRYIFGLSRKDVIEYELILSYIDNVAATHGEKSSVQVDSSLSLD